jgi:hypothetical protein
MPCVHVRLKHISDHSPNSVPCCEKCYAPGCLKDIIYGEMNNHLRSKCHSATPAATATILAFPGVSLDAKQGDS